MLTFLPPSFAATLQIPLASFSVSAGFPSPANDYLKGRSTSTSILSGIQLRHFLFAFLAVPCEERAFSSAIC